MKQNVLGGMDQTVPGGLKKLLDDIAGTEKICERLKSEVLQDQDARRVCNCPLSLGELTAHGSTGRLCCLSPSKVCLCLPPLRPVLIGSSQMHFVK